MKLVLRVIGVRIGRSKNLQGSNEQQNSQRGEGLHCCCHHSILEIALPEIALLLGKALRICGETRIRGWRSAVHFWEISELIPVLKVPVVPMRNLANVTQRVEGRALTSEEDLRLRNQQFREGNQKAKMQLRANFHSFGGGANFRIIVARFLHDLIDNLVGVIGIVMIED